ncbi:type I-E CRISPR-associated endoribonuclease Cas2e [Lentilactobacillus sp. G22-6]|uniref:type I-E CRISPR-associated endoribonuclease Cas2e n=1 Tax=Lentilactobacillus dabitei TaxID=2831523 RepID=UPI001C26B42E|nr:type I-E CRISPR-associated endoribonuclease Cas2e [Lentilactobacillus dabitei]MBU9788340.1 type I-E CRISPR-associated endoribonuclease Cas2e [Lentilactobacillus dabitei]
MIVVTLTKAPQSLRGDLTKWYQEVQTGVYVGNVSARIRDLLWDRINRNIGSGEATMVYNANNELGYQIKTTRKQYQVVDFDGIPLMMRLKVVPGVPKHGFSNAAKFHRAKIMMNKRKSNKPNQTNRQFVAVDLETTGLNAMKDKIISIGAIKRTKNGEYDQFDQLIQIDCEVPKKITELTNISSELLATDGIDLSLALQKLKDFVGSSTVIGYNLRFDQEFLSEAFHQTNQSDLTNEMLDIMPMVKKSNQFLDNYRLNTVLKAYQIDNSTPHHALADAKATLNLAIKLIEKGHL